MSRKSKWATKFQLKNDRNSYGIGLCGVMGFGQAFWALRHPTGLEYEIPFLPIRNSTQFHALPSRIDYF